MVASTTQKVEASAVEITAKDETGKESQYELTAKNVRNADQMCIRDRHDKGDSDCDESAVVYVSSVILISGNLAS